jgi:hypothetical protein
MWGKGVCRLFHEHQTPDGWPPDKIHGFVERCRIGKNGRILPETVAEIKRESTDRAGISACLSVHPFWKIADKNVSLQSQKQTIPT